ncbi:MAG: Bacterial rane protein YfhO, partial [Chthonomonadales bacterium]|nr:Bacterial rane protein YfhO [Chthonomonadales bacterium]
SFGILGGIYWLAFFAVPGVSNFHDPARFLFYATFAFAVLSAVGLDALRERMTWCNRRVCQYALVGIALPLIWFGQEWNPTTTVAALEAGVRSETVAYGRAKTERLYLPEHNLYWRRFVSDGYSDYGATDPRTIEALRETLIPNLPMGQGIAMAAGYEPVPISAVAGVDGLVRAALRRGEPNTDNLLSLMQIGVVALPKFQHTFDPGLALPGQTALPGRVSQFQVVGVPPAKAWLVRSTRHIEGKMRASAVMTAPGFDPRREAIVTGPGAVNLTDSGGVRGTVTLLDLSETTARMRVDAGSTAAYLVYSSTAYPGWMGRIDGKRIQPVRTDGAFLGLPIPPGKHEVAFEYRPSASRLGGFLSLLATCLCVAMCVKIALERLHRGTGYYINKRSQDDEDWDELGEELTDNA